MPYGNEAGCNLRARQHKKKKRVREVLLGGGWAKMTRGGLEVDRLLAAAVNGAPRPYFPGSVEDAEALEAAESAALRGGLNAAAAALVRSSVTSVHKTVVFPAAVRACHLRADQSRVTGDPDHRHPYVTAENSSALSCGSTTNFMQAEDKGPKTTGRRRQGRGVVVGDQCARAEAAESGGDWSRVLVHEHPTSMDSFSWFSYSFSFSFSMTRRILLRMHRAASS
eukprot:SAG22_NODE_2797_length_2203_cov_1.468631_1_plen_224_part_00